MVTLQDGALAAVADDAREDAEAFAPNVFRASVSLWPPRRVLLPGSWRLPWTFSWQVADSASFRLWKIQACGEATVCATRFQTKSRNGVRVLWINTPLEAQQRRARKFQGADGLRA